ncbi:Vacuolar protein sorting-associated protein 13C [Aphelenchoides bicaudatus]|nr:Vacuolar protein sorting-associated protein 13C [Aphelenchoides bicaudatus]
MRPSTSQALVLSFSCTADVDNKEGVQQVDGRVQGLQIVSTYFAHDKRHLAHYSVLQKMDIVLAGTVNTETREQEFAVCIDQVHLKVSPAVIRLLSAVGASFSENRGADQNGNKKVPVLKEYPNYWDPKNLDHSDYWWFTELAEEAGDALEQGDEDLEQQVELAIPAITNERVEFRIDSFIITIEAGLSETTMPMILLESSMEGSAENWTGKLSVDAWVQFQVSYYNEAYSVWEPVVEPVQRQLGQWDRWQLSAKIRSHSEDELTDAPVGGRQTPMPKMTIDLTATEMLNITVTKSFLQLLTALGDSFEKASKQVEPPKQRDLPGTSPYLVRNETGIQIKIRNSETLKSVDGHGGLVDAPHNEFVHFDTTDGEQPIGLQPEEDKKSTELILQLLDTERLVDVHRAEIRRIPLNKYADSGIQWHLVVETELENARRVISLKSQVRFVNHMKIPFEVFTTANSTQMDSCGVAKPDGEPLNIPLNLLYTATGEFFFQPTDDTYELSQDSFSWHSFDQTNRHTFRCDSSQNNREGLYVELVVTTEEIRGEKGRAFVDNLYTVHIYPPLQFRNLLPIDIHLKEPIEATLKGGEDIPLNVIAGQQIRYSVEYNGGDYEVQMKLKQDPEDLEIVTLTTKDEKELHLGAHWGTEYSRRECSIYAPYWTVNSTGKRIHYVSEFEIEHGPEAESNPVMIPYPNKQFNTKKKAYVRVEDSEKSDEFPLDTVGNAGRITCKTKEGREFELTVDVQLCQSRLTKIVTFTAFYLLQNNSKFDIEVREYHSETWTSVSAETCIPYWPTQKDARKLMCVRYKGQPDESVLFPFTENFEEFCPTNSKHLGFYVACTVAESSSVINIDSFHQGMASALLINDTNTPINFVQKGLPAESGFTLMPQQQQIFTYSDLTRKDRSLEWTSGQAAGTLSLLTDNLSSYESSKQNLYHYWASFLHGRQRTVLFTEDVSIATIAKEAFEVERMDQQIELSLHGIGISLVNNIVGQEIIYMGMSSSGFIWQQKVRARYRPFAVKVMVELEEAYQEWIEKGREDKFIDVGESSINFQNMILRRKKKTKNEVKIRRSYQNGLYMMYRKSAHQTQVHMKLNHLQIDNQLPASVYPIVLAMVPPPRSVVADNEPKPFAEFSFIMQQSEHSNILQIKYLHLLVQEFDVRVDKGLVEAVLSMLDSEQISVPYTVDLFKKDLELARPKLQERVITTKASKQKSFYHDLHISPLMVHLSFSQGGTSKRHGPGARLPAGQAGLRFFSIFQVLMKSVGVTVTEVQDVVFKLAYFDRKNTFYNKVQLQSEVTSHYTKQFLKQLYVLVFGLEILGNPYGLVVDVVGGVQDFFYQPFQGAIQGPEEFAEGFAIGLTSIISHSVGGITGAASKITGTVGKGIAALTMDEEYQRKRQEAINRRPQNFTEGMARGVDNLTQGVVQGVTGVITKPLEGARQGGVGGFFGGVGRGLVGVVARPLSGAVDFTSNTFNAVKNIATNAEDVTSLRPARLIPVDQIVRPYVYNEACGYKIFRDTEKGYYADTENFLAHAYINEKNVFIVTDRRVILSTRNSLTGSWSSEWTHEFSEIKRPIPVDSGVKLEFKQEKKGILDFGAIKFLRHLIGCLFPCLPVNFANNNTGIGGSAGKGILFADRATADSINPKLLSAYDNAE